MLLSDKNNTMRNRRTHMATTLLCSLLLFTNVVVDHSFVLGWSRPALDRRTWFTQILLSHLALAPPAAAATASGELPMALRSYTKLAPLHKNNKSAEQRNNATAAKSYHLPLDEIASRLTSDLTVGATGQGSYIVTGDLSDDIFRDTCSFIDPTNKVDSLQQYQRALTILFDPVTSSVDLLEPLTVNKVDSTITGRYRCRGTLKFRGIR